MDYDETVKTFVGAYPLPIPNRQLFNIFIFKNYFCIKGYKTRYFKNLRYEDEETLVANLIKYGGYLLDDEKRTHDNKVTSKTWLEILRCKRLKREEVPRELVDRILIEDL